MPMVRLWSSLCRSPSSCLFLYRKLIVFRLMGFGKVLKQATFEIVFHILLRLIGVEKNVDGCFSKRVASLGKRFVQRMTLR